MPRHPRPIADIARAVVDGTAVDWPGAAARARPEDRGLLGQLEVVAGIARCHRELPAASHPPDHGRLGGEAPAVWGPLQLFEPIGRGACGHVYRAWDTRLDREVALKLVPARARGAGPDASSIIHEGRLLARVHHPNVVTIYGAVQVGDRVGLWMELVRGRTLGDLVRDGHDFTPKELRVGEDRLMYRRFESVVKAGPADSIRRESANWTARVCYLRAIRRLPLVMSSVPPRTGRAASLSRPACD